MTITITNNKNADVMEYESVTGGTLTFVDSLADNVTVFNPKIVKVTSSVEGMVFTCNGTNVVSYSGSWSDVFDRHIKYVLEDDTRHDVTRFSDLPEKFDGLYAYIPPTSNTLLVTVSFNRWYGAGPVDEAHSFVMAETYQFTVHYDYATAVASFKDAIKDGDLYKVALSKGKVG